jgi:hypothetical protein
VRKVITTKRVWDKRRNQILDLKVDQQKACALLSSERVIAFNFRNNKK